MPSLPVTRSHALALAVGLLALLAVAGRTLMGTGSSSTEPAGALVATRSPAAVSRLVVHVTSAVAQQGLYRLKEGARVADAVVRAGGTTALADPPAVKLAAPLANRM
ncbi:MAG: SLBB domain-containing protein [Gaiellaceae bacterium]